VNVVFPHASLLKMLLQIGMLNLGPLYYSSPVLQASSTSFPVYA